MIFRFILYGLMGLAVEVVWTAIYDKIFNKKEGWDLQGTTYVWMLPIYGMTVFLFEPAHNLIRDMLWYYRGAIYVVGIFAVEYAAGYALRRLGHCPWDYSDKTPLHLHGLIRFDYIPAWFVMGFAMETAHDFLVDVTPLLYTVLRDKYGLLEWYLFN